MSILGRRITSADLARGGGTQEVIFGKNLDDCMMIHPIEYMRRERTFEAQLFREASKCTNAFFGGLNITGVGPDDYFLRYSNVIPKTSCIR